MMTFELTNKQREFFGLDPIENHWIKIPFKGDTRRPDSTLYFEGDTIKRHIISTENRYFEKQYNELTKERTTLLPKTNKGKEKKLSASVLEQRQPLGVYLNIANGCLLIGNYNTQTTFYSSSWDNENKCSKRISELVSEFIMQSPERHLQQINQFKNAKRRNVKFKSGDYFCFKLDRTNFGFGRLMLDVNKIRKKNLIQREHGLGLLMGPPVIVQLFAYKSSTKNVDISTLDAQPKLPADVMMDNLLLYGEYEIIGHRELEDDEFEFPISYGRSLYHSRVVFLQWGLIHLELPQEKFFKYVTSENESDKNPYGYYSIGFAPHFDSIDIVKTIENKGIYDFSKSRHYKAKWDLRNPANKEIKNELFKVFGLDPDTNYVENCKQTKTILTTELIKQL
jgi:hypothetical protein